VAARLEDDRLAQVIETLHGPRPLFQHGAPFGRRKSVDHQPQRLAGGMRVDRLNAMNHL
jgi:hypothetical protein